jgi:hypothetical protein
MHRDDIEILGVSTAEIRDKDGNVKAQNVPAIMRPSPSLEVHSSAIADVVDRKNARFATYKRGLSHVNLIVVDHFDGRRGFGEEYNATQLLASELRRALREGGFREVFLAARTPADTWAIRPLQMLRLLESFCLFLGAVVAFDEAPEDLGHEHLAPLFVRAFQHRDLDLYFSDDDEQQPCAVHRGVGINHSGDDIGILDFHDFPPPPATTPPPVPFTDDAMRRLVSHLDVFMEQNTFTTGLVLPEPTPREKASDSLPSMEPPP